MKKYLPDFFVGLGLGIFFFIVSGFSTLSPLSWQYWLYHIVISLVLFTGYFFYFRRSKGVSAKWSILIFLVGYILPSAIWILFGIIAIRRGHFSL